MLPAMPEDRYVDVDGINTRYWDVGTGDETILFLHGLGASAEIWVHNVEFFSRRYRVLIPDIVGFGRTDKPADYPYSPHSMVGFVDNFMGVMGISKAAVAGMSMGGGLSLLYALDHPEKVENLVLADSAGFGRDPALSLRILSVPFVGEVLSRPTRKGVEIFFRQAVEDPSVICRELIDIYYELHRLPGANGALLKVLRNMCSFNGGHPEIIDSLLSRLSGLKCNTLIVWGRQDRVLPVRHGREALSRIENARLHIFDPCGHMPNFECPEEFNDVVNDFLTSC